MPLPELPIGRKSTSYHRTSKEESEDDTIQKEEEEHEEDPFLEQAHFRPRRSKYRHTCIYPIVILLSLLLGVLGGQFMRVEYEIDGYPGTLPLPTPPISSSSPHPSHSTHRTVHF